MTVRGKYSKYFKCDAQSIKKLTPSRPGNWLNHVALLQSLQVSGLYLFVSVPIYALLNNVYMGTDS